MIKHYLLSPGPTPIPNEVQLAMAETMIHHRTPQFNHVFNETRAGLKKVFGTKNDVLMLASSGTGAMEASVANLFSPGENKFATEASIAPVPEEASMRTSFLVPKTFFSPARASLNT